MTGTPLTCRIRKTTLCSASRRGTAGTPAPPWAAGPPLVRRTGAAQSVRQLPRPDDAQAQAFRHEAVPTELRRTWQISDQTTRRCRRRILDGGDRG